METMDRSNAPIGEMRRLTRSNRLTRQFTTPPLLLPHALVDAYLDTREVRLNAVDYFHSGHHIWEGDKGNRGQVQIDLPAPAAVRGGLGPGDVTEQA